MTFKNAAALLVLAIASITSNVNAAVIGFDDLPLTGDPSAIADGYQGFSWNNFWSSRAGYDRTYEMGLVSGNNIGFMISASSVSSFSSTTPFTFNAVNISKMYYDGLTRFEGYIGETLAYSQDVFSNKAVSNIATFNWAGLTRVEISVRDGSERVVFDNLVVNEQISAVPEPASIGLFLAGLAFAGIASKRKKTV